MSGFKSAQDGDFFPDLGRIEAGRFLEMGLGDTGRPIDLLLDRLAETDGREWFTNTLRAVYASAELDTDGIAGGTVPDLQALKRIKSDAKKRVASVGDSRGQLSAMLGYFVTVGLALAFHGERICSRKRGELDPILLDLASACPEPWSDFLSRATLQPAK